VVDAAGAEALLRDPEAVAALAEQVAERHPHTVEAHLAVGVPAAAAMAEHRHGADDLQAGGARRDDDLGHAPVRRLVGLGDQHRDREGRALGARAEPLVPVDDPLVTVGNRGRPQPGRVGAGHLRLGHREERADLAGDQRHQPALALLLGAELVEDLGVARVGSLAAEDQRRPVASPDDLVQVGVGKEAEAGPARLGADERRPQPGRLRPCPEVLEQRLRLAVLAGQRPLVRVHVLVHEGSDPLADLADLLGHPQLWHGGLRRSVGLDSVYAA
jgi:hypothetical protein